MAFFRVIGKLSGLHRVALNKFDVLRKTDKMDILIKIYEFALGANRQLLKLANSMQPLKYYEK
jgi:hypothetical protein